MEKAAIGTTQAGLATVHADLAGDLEVSEEVFPEAEALPAAGNNVKNYIN